MISILQIFIVLNLLSGCSEEYDNKPDDSHFLGIDSNAKDLTYGNLPINAKTIATNCDFFCYSEETGNIYYTNFDDNGHLYQLSNGTKTKLVDKKCTNINFYNNNLYFISPDVSLNELTDWEVSGPIYKFDIESKEIELFLDVNAILMRVINDNIYHSERTLQETNSSQTNKNSSRVISSFVTNFEEKRTLKNEGTMLYYKDYEVTATGLINMDTSDKTDFELSEFGLATACVYNNVLYRNFRTFEH